MEHAVQLQAGGFTAQCPRCEAAHFTPVSAAQLLACGSCGTRVHRAALLHQIAAHARLTAEVLAAQLRIDPVTAN